MIKVVLDTNVYISAIVIGGKPEKIIDLAREGEIDIYISKPILSEIERILSQKFKWSKDEVQEALLELTSITKLTNPKVTLSAIDDDPDNRILECAVQERVDFLVSGDTKHLQPLKEYEGITILSPAGFLDEIEIDR